ncbi:TM2 domain-containing protein [Isoptericola sp. NPDC056578]|uniref:TM2 domain-containing protein n=1 Tax=Isoptericola sp. NPDC056578 TaxID=3345870 RepID=UPI0036764971
MTENPGSVTPPPHRPPPSPQQLTPPATGYAPSASSPVPPPPPGYGTPSSALPPPVPGTGASGQYPYQAAAPVQPDHPVSQGQLARPDKSIAVTYVLWFFLGVFGVHHFYLGKIGRGVGYVFTVGLFLVGWFIDLFTLPAQVRQINTMRQAGLR